MSSTPDAAIAALQTTALTGYCHNIYFRKQQLKSLHDTLRNHVSELQRALEQDAAVSSAESTAEVALALGVVKEHYEALDAGKELEKEYRIAKGKNHAERREPWGVVYLEVEWRHTPLYSAVTALSAAVAAGNCVGLKLENSLRALPAQLRTLLPQALDADIFAILTSAPSADALSNCLQVLQETPVPCPTHFQLSSSRGHVVAIVDRTADLASAAEHLVAARFAFGGTSPYAPDLVLVNEFVKCEFVELVLKHAIRYLAHPGNGSSNSSTAEKPPTAPPSRPSGTTTTTARINDTLSTLQQTLSRDDVTTRIITQGDRGAILELTTPTFTPKLTTDPILALSPITTLDHAIDLINNSNSNSHKNNNSSNPPPPNLHLQSAYHFASPTHAKYLAQFIPSHLTLINHIPRALLLGPARPEYQSSVSVPECYSSEWFARGAPTFVVVAAAAASSTPLTSAFSSSSSSSSSSSYPALTQGFINAAASGGASSQKKVLDAVTAELREEKRAEWMAHGFFEQGIFIGLGVVGVPVLVGVLVGVGVGVRGGLRGWWWG